MHADVNDRVAEWMRWINRLFRLYYNASTYESKTLMLLGLIENTDQNENNQRGAHFRYF